MQSVIIILLLFSFGVLDARPMMNDKDKEGMLLVFSEMSENQGLVKTFARKFKLQQHPLPNQPQRLEQNIIELYQPPQNNIENNRPPPQQNIKIPTEKEVQLAGFQVEPIKEKRFTRGVTKYEDWYPLGRLGKGAFGYVYLVYNGKEYAAIKFSSNQDIHEGNISILHEWGVLKEVPNVKAVTKFHSIFKVEDRQAIVMEVAKEGSLKSYLKRGNTIQEQDLKRSFKALVEGIKSFHLAGITLRDIKLDNILVFRDKKNLVQLKFADFGACTYDDELVDTVVGTPLYLPKEAFYQRKGFPFSQRKVNPVELEKVDIHALGVVLYLTLVPKAKFTRKQVKDKAAMLEWYLSDFDFECKEFQQLKKTNPIVADLLLHMLAPKVEERSTADQVLAHKWFLE